MDDACGGPIHQCMGTETCGTSLLAQTTQASSDPIITMLSHPTRGISFIRWPLELLRLFGSIISLDTCWFGFVGHLRLESLIFLLLLERAFVSDTLYSRSVRLGHGLLGTSGAQGRILLLSGLETELGLGLERVAQQRLAPVHPYIPAALAQWPQHLVVEGLDPVRTTRLALGGNNVDLLGDLLAVELQWQIVDVRSEGILDLHADKEKTEDDVAGSDCCWDGNPPKRGV